MFKKLGIAFTVFPLLVVLGCSTAGKSNGDVVQTAVPAALNIPTHTPTNLPTSTLIPTSTPTPTSTIIPCFRLLSPENSVKLNSTGKVTFSWETMQGAVNYKLEIMPPSSQPVIFEMTKTSRDQYLEAFQMGGLFEWKVTAFDASGTILCRTEAFTFEKPEYIQPAKTQNSGGSQNDGSSDGDGWDDDDGPGN